MTGLKVDWAMDYAVRVWAVVPLWRSVGGRCACGQANCPSPGKHPIARLAPHGVKDATTTPAVIRAWWNKYPQANVGIATGPVSGLLVIDLDLRHGGHPDKLPGPIPRTPKVRTGGGGWHFYLAWPHGLTRLPKNLPGDPGVDLKGMGGYVVAPPSCHVSGGLYRWVVPPAEVPPAPCPEWLLEAISKTQMPRPSPPVKPGSMGSWGTAYGRAALRHELARLAQAPVGDRNNALNRAAFALGKLTASGHLEEGRIVDLLVNVALQTGLDLREVERTIRSGLTAGMREGRP